MEACMCLRSWLRAGIKFIWEQELDANHYSHDNVLATNKPSCGSMGTGEAEGEVFPNHLEGEEEVVYIDYEEWSDNESYNKECD